MSCSRICAGRENSQAGVARWRYSSGCPMLRDPTLTVPFNNTAAVEAAFHAHSGQLAAVIVEPVCGNMGCIPPNATFLADLRRITAAHGSLLIFDEVMTGFRV